MGIVEEDFGWIPRVFALAHGFEDSLKRQSHPPLHPDTIVVAIVPTLASSGAPCARSQSYWMLNWLAPGSKPNNMAAVMEVNVSPQIDDFTNGVNLYEEKRPLFR